MSHKLKKIFILLLVLISFFITSCSVRYGTLSSDEKLRRLDIELQKWQNFRITGMSEIHYRAFNITRPCVLVKSKEKIRFDILDTGIFGLGGGIFMAFYADSEIIQYKLPGSQTITSKNLDDKMKVWFDFLSESIFEELKEQKLRIINTNYAMIRNLEFFFYPDMQLKEIRNAESEIAIVFIYNKNFELSQISISSPLIKNLTISIDKIDYSDNIVIPLR